MSVVILYFTFVYSLTFIQCEDVKHNFVLVKTGETAELRVNNDGGKDQWTNNKNVVVEPLNSNKVADGYEYECNGNDCVFKIENVSENKAGKYKYTKIVDGYSHTSSFELLVADIQCHLQVSPNMIGQNDCQAVPQDTLTRTCTVRYQGNNKYYPSIKWRVINPDGSDKSPSGHFTQATNITGEAGDLVWQLKDSISVGSTDQMLKCYVEGSSLDCLEHLPKSNILYARNKTDSELSSHHLKPMTRKNKKSVSCEANKSAQVECIYKWMHYTNNIRTEFKGAVLKEEHLMKYGRYECLAYCAMGDYPSDRCVLLADRFDYEQLNQSSISSLFYVIPVVLMAVFLIAVMMFILIRKRKRNSQKRNEENKKKLNDEVEMEHLKSKSTTTATTATSPMLPPTEGSTQSVSTPMPQIKPPLQNGSKKFSFKRSNSSLKKIKEEGFSKVIINDSQGDVKGLGILGDRIFCVCSGSSTLFVYHKETPHNRLKPEEVSIVGLKRPEDLAVCVRSHSVFVCDYTDESVVFRVYPKMAENKICRGKVDGYPASMSIVGVEKEMVVVLVKQDRKMLVKVYNTSNSINKRGEVESVVVWESKQVFELRAEVNLPLKACISVVPKHPNQHSLFVLSGSGRLRPNKIKFSTYVVDSYVLQTGRLLDNSFDFSPISSNSISSMVTDVKEGGVYLLENASKAVLWHLDHNLSSPKRILNIESPCQRFCVDDTTAVFGVKSASNACLVFVDLGGLSHHPSV